ncbi:unnamed protein product [Allacma fusca]|uniref:Uncharacterized protein n=1 Tax=Allacma fusca TaxID=39272 RepID=A0A8J2JLL6_9HEXA|nr:unnamed protein product [Allacma fusca]
MKTSLENFNGSPVRSNSRRILSRQTRTESSGGPDGHTRRMELVRARAEMVDSIVRRRLLSLLKSERGGTGGQSKSKGETTGRSETSLKVSGCQPFPAFPTEDEGVDFSWIYCSGSQDGLGNYDGSLGDDGPGVDLVLEPFGFTKSVAPAGEEALKETEVVCDDILPNTVCPIDVAVKLQRIDVSPESGNISDDPSILSDSDMESFYDDEF